MSDSFFENAKSIVESKRAAKDSGRNLQRWQSHGVFFHPDTPAHIRNALVVHRPSEQEWEIISLELHADLKPETPSPKPKSTKTIIRK